MSASLKPEFTPKRYTILIHNENSGGNPHGSRCELHKPLASWVNRGLGFNYHSPNRPVCARCREAVYQQHRPNGKRWRSSGSQRGSESGLTSRRHPLPPRAAVGPVSGAGALLTVA